MSQLKTFGHFLFFIMKIRPYLSLDLNSMMGFRMRQVIRHHNYMVKTIRLDSAVLNGQVRLQ